MHCRIATAAAAQHSSHVPSLDQRLSEIEARLEEFEGQPELQSAGRTEGSDQNWRVFAASLRQNIFDHVNAIEAKLHVLEKDTRVSLFKVADFVDEARIDLNARVANLSVSHQDVKNVPLCAVSWRFSAVKVACCWIVYGH